MVVFLSDDHTWRDSSVYGSPDIKTPNMARQARAGMTFDNAFVASPSCAPSRAALLTGMYPARNGAEPNHSRPRADIKKLPAYLQEQGYEVVSFGKVGHYRQTPEYGFDVARHFNYHEDVAVDEAVKWLHARESKKPLCLFVGSNWPHVPWPEDIGPVDPQKLVVPPNHVDTPTTREWRARYMAAIRIMDDELGKVHNAARRVLGDDVFFLHTSDHGAQWPFGKWCLYEDGVRTPLIVSWPGRIRAGIRSDALVSWIDILPTLVDVAGGKMPGEIDGRSIIPVLRGGTDAHRDIIFTTHSGDGNWNVFPIRAARDADGWKYIRNLHPEYLFESHVTKVPEYEGYWSSWVAAAKDQKAAQIRVQRYQRRLAEELYNTEADPYEQRNLINEPEHAPRVAALKSRLDVWMRETGDPQKVFGSPRFPSEVDPGTSLPYSRFVNPIGEGADPWITRDPNVERYLWCMSHGNRAIAIHTSRSPASMGRRHIVWRAPKNGPVSKQVWAPELHYLEGRWHIYFAASDGKNENHLAYVLRSKTRDPLGEYELFGPLATGEGPDGRSPNIWAIDMTVLTLKGRLYAVWSGWDAPGTDRQYLYIAQMASPTRLAAPRTRICANDGHLWERIERRPGARGLNEAPQVFQSPKATAIVYSCGASWLPTYKLGLLEFVGNDPLNSKSWKKRKRPMFEGSGDIHGVGHSCFVQSLDGEAWWHIYHAKRSRQAGWQRAVYAQPMSVGSLGYPIFGRPHEAGSPLPLPAGAPELSGELNTARYAYFGHHQFLKADGDTIHLGLVPKKPVNAYRSGEKIVLDQPAPNDMRSEVTIDFMGGADARDAGILFRCTAPAVGFDAQRGYFAGLIPKAGVVILGKTDGSRWLELARAKTEIAAARPHRLAVQIVGDAITVWHDGEERLRFRDADYAFGSAGLRVVNTHAAFTDFVVRSADPGRD